MHAAQQHQSTLQHMSKRKYRNDWPQPELARVPQWLRQGPPRGGWPKYTPQTPERARLEFLARLTERVIGRQRSHLTAWERQTERFRRMHPDRQQYVYEYVKARRERARELEHEARAAVPLRTRLAIAQQAERAQRRAIKRALRAAQAAYRRWRKVELETGCSAECFANLVDLHWIIKRNKLFRN